MTENKDICKKCGSKRVYEVKRWSMKSPRSRSVSWTILMKCRTCGKTYREYE